MAKIDETKEFIGFLKAVFITAIVIMSSLVAYLYKEEIENNVAVLIALMFDIIVIIGLYKRILKEIKSLKDL
jgi:preprotein translocase subunit SecF